MLPALTDVPTVFVECTASCDIVPDELGLLPSGAAGWVQPDKKMAKVRKNAAGLYSFIMGFLLFEAASSLGTQSQPR